MGLLFLALKEPIPPIFRLLRNVYERVSTSDTKKSRFFPLWLRFYFLELSKWVFSECLRAKYWCFWSSKSMSIANALSMLLLLLLLLKRHEQSECHSLWFCIWFCPWFSFYSFNKLLKAFRHPSRPIIARLSNFKKVLLEDNQVLLEDKSHFKKYFWRT